MRLHNGLSDVEKQPDKITQAAINPSFINFLNSYKEKHTKSGSFDNPCLRGNSDPQVLLPAEFLKDLGFKAFCFSSSDNVIFILLTIR